MFYRGRFIAFSYQSKYCPFCDSTLCITYSWTWTCELVVYLQQRMQWGLGYRSPITVGCYLVFFSDFIFKLKSETKFNLEIKKSIFLVTLNICFNSLAEVFWEIIRYPHSRNEHCMYSLQLTMNHTMTAFEWCSLLCCFHKIYLLGPFQRKGILVKQIKFMLCFLYSTSFGET